MLSNRICTRRGSFCLFVHAPDQSCTGLQSQKRIIVAAVVVVVVAIVVFTIVSFVVVDSIVAQVSLLIFRMTELALSVAEFRVKFQEAWQICITSEGQQAEVAKAKMEERNIAYEKMLRKAAEDAIHRKAQGEASVSSSSSPSLCSLGSCRSNSTTCDSNPWKHLR